jgi:hypothetical protein
VDLLQVRNGLFPLTEAFLAQVTLEGSFAQAGRSGRLFAVVVTGFLFHVVFVLLVATAAAAEDITVVDSVFCVLVFPQVALRGEGRAGTHLTLEGPFWNVAAAQDVVVVVAVFSGQVAVAVGLGGEPEGTLWALVGLVTGVGQDVTLERGSPGEQSAAERTGDFVWSC